MTHEFRFLECIILWEEREFHASYVGSLCKVQPQMLMRQRGPQPIWSYGPPGEILHVHLRQPESFNCAAIESTWIFVSFRTFPLVQQRCNSPSFHCWVAAWVHLHSKWVASPVLSDESQTQRHSFRNMHWERRSAKDREIDRNTPFPQGKKPTSWKKNNEYPPPHTSSRFLTSISCVFSAAFLSSKARSFWASPDRHGSEIRAILCCEGGRCSCKKRGPGSNTHQYQAPEKHRAWDWNVDFGQWSRRSSHHSPFCILAVNQVVVICRIKKKKGSKSDEITVSGLDLVFDVEALEPVVASQKGVQSHDLKILWQGSKIQ